MDLKADFNMNKKWYPKLFIQMLEIFLKDILT